MGTPDLSIGSWEGGLMISSEATGCSLHRQSFDSKWCEDGS